MSNSNKKQCRASATEDELCSIKNGGHYFDTQINIETTKYSKPKDPHWLYRRIYILTWIRSYNREAAVADLIAGVTLGLTIIPQSIAYASLAGLTAEYGLYSAFIGSLIYVFFGTTPQVSIGPTSLMAILVSQFCADKPVQFVIVLSFLAGLVEFLMGVFQLGFIVNFIPSSVTKAFTTATSAIIVLVQMKNLLGVKLKGLPPLAKFWAKIRLGDAILGVTCLFLLLGLRQLSNMSIKKQTDFTRRFKKLCWYISISRNALVVVCAATFSYIWIYERSLEAMPFTLVAKVESALPTVRLPPFAFEYNNATYVFMDICRELGSGIIVVPIVAVLANVAIAKAFVKDGQLDASQEMLTLGLCNIAGSFFSAMPTCGAFTRSAVSQASGVRTPMAGIYTGILVLSAISVLTPYFQFIPKSSLSAVLIAAVVFMVDFTPMRDFWRNNKKDFFSWTGCFIVCVLAGVQRGLLFGILINMIYILLRLGNPKIEVHLKMIDGIRYIHITPMSDVYYTGVDYLRNEIRSASVQYCNDFPIVVDCSRFMQFDVTFMEMINAIAKELQQKHVLLVLHQLPQPQKLQQLLPAAPNVRFCSDEFGEADLTLPK